jgi:hypothetical protein
MLFTLIFYGESQLSVVAVQFEIDFSDGIAQKSGTLFGKGSIEALLQVTSASQFTATVGRRG